ncbi:MAG TPA: ribosome-associated translation inhibitor RaiA [Saprospiraceae bacterium]|nr:ribosome-associated translation inhibitor RaiA [Saprospiraceae bacterium]HMQ82651.1 ribosome-associated translation inhibitor RaiA [Saprospiraceae bacterium]
MRIHTEAVQFKADQKLITFIEKKMTKMTQFYDRIIEANVILKLENSGQVKDKIAEVKLSVPGEVLFAKESSKTFEASVDSATESLRRQLEKYKDRLAK